MQKEILDNVIIRGQQNFEHFEKLNRTDARIEDNQILNVLQKHTNGTCRFLSIRLLFFSRIKNNTNQIFIVCNGLSNPRDSLINEKPCKILGVINLNNEYNWENIKEILIWGNITFKDSDEPNKAEHFGFAFKTQNVRDILRFQFNLLDCDTK